MSLTISDRRLGAMLLEQGLISDEDLHRAIEAHTAMGGGRLSDILIQHNIVSERRIAKVIEENLGIPLVDLLKEPLDPSAYQLLPGQTAQQQNAFPFAADHNRRILKVAFLDPLHNMSLETVEDDTNYSVEPYQGLRSQLQWAIAKHYPELNLSIPEVTDIGHSEVAKVGQIMLRRGFIKESQLTEALTEQQNSGEPLGRVLVRMKYISEDQLYEVLSEHAGVPFIRNPKDYEPSDEVLGHMLRSDAIRLQAVPLEEHSGALLVGSSDFRNRAEIEGAVGRPVKLALILPLALQELIERFYPEKSALGEALLQQGKITREQLLEGLSIQRRTKSNKPLGEILVDLGYLKVEDLESALSNQKSSNTRLEDTLVQSGKISEETIARSLALQLGYDYVNLNETQAQLAVAQMVSEATARRYTVIPLRMQGNALVVAMKDPRHIFAIDDLRVMTGKDIVPVVAQEKDILKAIERIHGNTDISALNKELASLRGKDTGKEESSVLDSLDDNAIVKVVDTIIREAALQEASDIHIEPNPTSLKVRFRVDGALREYQELPKSAANSIAARIKILGNLDIAERRVPQDGRVRFRKGAIDLDLRLSTLPTVYGEKIVMRLLQKASNIPEVEQLGFSEHNYQRFIDTIEKPYGIFLITGPTGSGKSFTTFSILKRISTPDSNTTTVEDPVEYEIPGINQTQVNVQAGMTFAKALRSFLRQDPDIIMVGEIRDGETAQIATEAALTGHLVIATLHTNDSPGAITRLEEMGVESFNISAALIGVLAQRLVRKVCQNCKVAISADPEVLRKLGLQEKDIRNATLYRGTGCAKCNQTGYKGRMAIHELLVVDEHVKKGINTGKAATEIKEIAIAQSGLKTLRTDGLEKALQGMTTLEEILGNTNE
ncbi:ATPase, T2SS/T4P/T4SS family [Deinococcus misasensis]|uniref:ATPase, T2SS/T4P/T4SS family n=1 Tax=Deinococcus misasensis TaxID=392413 RepID=UPI00054FEB5E|nr:ATPase, T2SS/T4P/T4SS family [Deinococcus misasensis]